MRDRESRATIHVHGSGTCIMLPFQTATPTEARKQFFTLLDKVTDLRNLVVINRKGKENVVLIAESDLSSLLETAYLLKSPKNAQHLLAAIERSQARDTQPVEPKSTEQAIAELKQELVLEQEEDKASI
jgi:antitoxin YefM